VESVEIVSPLVGRHNVQNSLAAAGAAIAVGVPLAAVAAGLTSCGCVPGRLQRVASTNGRNRGFSVLVDYAHTDDALANVLSALRPLTRGRLIVMFGCGGDRDPTKRPRMARVAAQWADRIVVTSDNPRTEDPQRIIDQILTGFEPGQMDRVKVEPNRRKAIAMAVAEAGEGDVVLLAGKGHENYQIIGTERLPFDDAQVAAEAMERK
jgi:UDP-N-acetylmuramoyl-L-alanyl-D-glutamate--2,6-diaminopimelate ligase